MNPNPGQAQGFYLDPSGMPLPGLTPLPLPNPPPQPSSAAPPTVDAARKVRKPYTITKSRESWTEQEHDKFLEALQLFDRDWKKIEAYVGSKTVIQIRSHAQKYFLKVQKSGSNERVPPPRPKRKAAHPYPQKAAKIAPSPSQSMGTYQAAPTVYQPGYVHPMESSSMITDQPTSAPSWNYSSVPPVGPINVKKEDAMMPVCATLPSGCCSSSSESALSEWPAGGPSDSRNLINKTKVMPDFAQVYSFLGSVFDPDACDHLKRLKMMDPIDIKTVLLLMRNLSVNLMSPEFEHYRKLLSSYDIKSERIRPCSPMLPIPDNSKTAIPAV